MTRPFVAQVPAAFLSIKTQFDNLGDALINRELCRLVAGRAETYVDFSRAPRAFEQSMQVTGLANLTILRNLGFLRLLAKIAGMRLKGRACFLFLNPGGLGGRSKPFKSRASAAVYNVVLGCLQLVGVKICHVGISFDAMDRPERRLAKWRRRLLHSFTVRDRLSYSYLEQIGMPADAIVPDLSFNLYHSPATAPRSGRDAISFSFRFDGKAANQQILHSVRGAMLQLGTNYEYIFVVQVARDLKGMSELHAACSELGMRTQLLVCHDDIEALSSYYLDCVAIYSNRLHSLLLAAHAGASPYALVARGKQPKIEGMFNDLGLGDRLCFIDAEGTSLPAITPVPTERFVEEYGRLQKYFDDLMEMA